MKVRFVLLPPNSMNKIALRLAKKAAKESANYFVVDGKKLFFHISLIHPNIEVKAIKSFYKGLQDIVRQTKPLGLIVKGYDYLPEGIWLGLKINNDKILTGLRLKIYQLAKLHGGKFLPNLKIRFHPHITLTKFKQKGRGFFVVKRMPKIKKNFKVDTLALCKTNKYFQVTKIIKQFKLK